MAESGACGLIVFDKPTGLTSRAALNAIQKRFARGTAVGHAGTLDPLATGVLVVCVGPATRLVEYVQRMDKEYVTDLVLGAVSDTDDADGTITAAEGTSPPPPDVVRRELAGFVGVQQQTPPAFSAAHVAGRRAHELARRGKAVTLEPRPVRIDAIDLLAYDYPDLRLRVRCGKGTYIRSIARDLGRRLGCGAYVRTLRRNRIGPFSEAIAVPLESIQASAAAPTLLAAEHAVAELPALHIDAEQHRRLCQGQSVTPAEGHDGPEHSGEVAVFAAGRFCAVGRWDADAARLFPAKVMFQA